MSLLSLLDKYNRGTEPSERDLHECLELAQNELDRIGDIAEALPNYDKRVVVRIDNESYLSRFSSIDALADWIVEGWQHERSSSTIRK